MQIQSQFLKYIKTDNQNAIETSTKNSNKGKQSIIKDKIFTVLVSDNLRKSIVWMHNYHQCKKIAKKRQINRYYSFLITKKLNKNRILKF